MVIAKKVKRKKCKFIIMCKIHPSELWELRRNNGITAITITETLRITGQNP